MDTSAIMKEIKSNREALLSCARHAFPKRGPTYRLGEKLKCTRCGGLMSLPDAASYMRGYVAHGGSATDIIPDWEVPQAQAGGESGHE